MCPSETYRRVRVNKHLSDMFRINSGVKQGDALSPLLFNIALDYAIRKVQGNKDTWKLNGTRQLLVCDNDVNTNGGRSENTKKSKTQKL
jgi:hypothetical protein